MRFNASMLIVVRLFTVLIMSALFTIAPAVVRAQDLGGPVPGLTSPIPGLPTDGINNYLPPLDVSPSVPGVNMGAVTLAAKLTDASGDIGRGLTWRVFSHVPDQDGKLPLVASSQGGTATFDLEPGRYLVHCAFGRAGATKHITIAKGSKRETIVLDAGGLQLNAVTTGGARIPEGKLKFSIYEADEDTKGERALIIPDVAPNRVVRLNAGVYHVVSTYGAVNAVIRSDIRVEAGKLTKATVEHKAAEVTMKLVRDEGGEAIADTSWSVLTDTGDIVKESVGAFASMVLAEGKYSVVAKNRDRIYQREVEVVSGINDDVEVLTENSTPAAAPSAGASAD
ncbi:MAG: hypothetical protein WBA44_04905 [Mesorhizobium sp.]